jgi:3-isopropylmalate/(R)-2-methylmalate dehydratase small subunit
VKILSFIFENRIWKFGDNISIDLLKPQITRVRNMTNTEAAKYVMYANRPTWIDEVESGDIIVGGKNFGCGSSRLAIGPIKELGISCIIAESMARIFFRNAINYGFPVLIAPGIQNLCQEGEVLRINIITGEIKNITLNTEMKVEPLPQGSPPMQILKAGGIIEFLKQEKK